jgi:hypothetical protein
MSFYTGTQVELLYTLTAPFTKNTYAGPAVFSAPAATAPVAKVPGGFFEAVPNGVGRSLFFEAFGTIANAATGFTFTPELCVNTTAGTIGSSNIAIYAATAPTASVTAQWHLQGYITCQALGETGGMTWQVNGGWSQTTVASGGVANATGLQGQFAGSLTGLLAATTYYLELGGTWSTSSASATTTLQQMFMWGLN